MLRGRPTVVSTLVMAAYTLGTAVRGATIAAGAATVVVVDAYAVGADDNAKRGSAAIVVDATSDGDEVDDSTGVD